MPRPRMSVFCDILEPDTGEGYARDPRMIAKRTEAYLKQTKIGDTVFVGPEAEFFIFDDVKFPATPYNTGFKLDSVELPINSDRDYETGNMGHRMRTKGGYFPVNPMDFGPGHALGNALGHGRDGPHRREAPPRGGLRPSMSSAPRFQPLVTAADHMQIYKYVIHNVAHAYGKTATFMPKPVFGDNGSGMHCHFSIWKDGKPQMAGNQYADLSELCLYFIGGVIKHAKALNAFTNPSTNSYKRLVPGYEAPVLLAYSSRNRSASCRIPFTSNPKAKRVEVRFPDPDRQPLSGLLGHHHGRPRRHREQDPSRPGHGQEPLRPAAGRARPGSRPSAAACRKPSTASRPTTTSSPRATCSARTRSKAISTSSRKSRTATG